MNQQKKFRPQNLQTILVILFALILIGGGGTLYYYFEFVKDYAATVSNSQAQADASAKQVNELQALGNQSSSTDELINKVNQLFATSDNYQAQMSNDIKHYAAAAGLKVTSLTPSNDGSHGMVVKLDSPTSYTKLITFLHTIETSMPKLQVRSLSLHAANTSNPDSIGVGDINIEVLVR